VLEAKRLEEAEEAPRSFENPMFNQSPPSNLYGPEPGGRGAASQDITFGVENPVYLALAELRQEAEVAEEEEDGQYEEITVTKREEGEALVDTTVPGEQLIPEMVMEEETNLTTLLCDPLHVIASQQPMETETADSDAVLTQATPTQPLGTMITGQVDHPDNSTETADSLSGNFVERSSTKLKDTSPSNISDPTQALDASPALLVDTLPTQLVDMSPSSLEDLAPAPLMDTSTTMIVDTSLIQHVDTSPASLVDPTSTQPMDIPSTQLVQKVDLPSEQVLEPPFTENLDMNTTQLVDISANMGEGTNPKE
jgi:hypothetical protein